MQTGSNTFAGPNDETQRTAFVGNSQSLSQSRFEEQPTENVQVDIAFDVDQQANAIQDAAIAQNQTRGRAQPSIRRSDTTEEEFNPEPGRKANRQTLALEDDYNINTSNYVLEEDPLAVKEAEEAQSPTDFHMPSEPIDRKSATKMVTPKHKK